MSRGSFPKVKCLKKNMTTSLNCILQSVYFSSFSLSSI